MQRLNNRIVVSASDFNDFLACEHLTALELKALSGASETAPERPAQAKLLAKLGEEHEENYLRKLLSEGRSVTKIGRRSGYYGILRAAGDTEAAMERGDEVIYQATFFDGESLGYADFLRKVDAPSVGGRWAWHYEVEDTKLARQSEPYFLLQLSFYSDHVARIQGIVPLSMHVILGNEFRETFRVADFAAYYRSVRKMLLQRLAEDRDTYPVPVPHCSLCTWDERCTKRRENDDHLSLVANMTRQQTNRLNATGITTLEALAVAPETQKPAKMHREIFERLRRQARLQAEQRNAVRRGDPDPRRFEILESGIVRDDSAQTEPPRREAARGFYRLPEPSPGDVFFDMEGDPYFKIGTGLEYLFGAYTPQRTFHAFWGCDRRDGAPDDRLAEKRAFEAFVDFVTARRAEFPDMHVYHYASYEKSALQKLSLRHATREEEVDNILREEWLVDLYAVVRQAIAVGQPSYSIKMIEEYFGKRGTASQVKAGDESILRFEEWLASRENPEHRDDGILDDLELYNKYDCISTLRLRDWLLNLRERAAAEFGVTIPPYAGREVETPPSSDAYVELKAALDARIPEDFDPESSSERWDAVRPIFIARHMLEYHWRERKPILWRFHDRCEKYADDAIALFDDAECILGLTYIGKEPIKQSFLFEFAFPAQPLKIEDGDCFDLATKAKAGSIESIEEFEDGGRVKIKRGKSLDEIPLPEAITTRKIVQEGPILDAIARFAETLLESGTRSRYRAAFDVLTGAPPRIRGIAVGAPIQPETVDDASMRALCGGLDDSYLFIQGPPGAGKTYLGARLILDLIASGKKIGITANSHKAIHNLLDEIERVAVERNVEFNGLKKSSKDNKESYYASPHIKSSDASLAVDGIDLVAGTAWAFSPAAMDARLDYLFIDEAGQVSLPNAIAAMTAARNVVLLGDPLQLAQVALTHHPGDLGASVLEHLLGHELRPVAPERGVLLADSYRMHPDVCRFISELLYEGKLRSAAGRELQEVRSPGLGGSGLRYLAVEHTGNAQSSDEEAQRVATEIEHLLAGTVRDFRGRVRPLTAADIIVVTPYNAQVRCIRRVLESRGHHEIEVGTVDKFQGREAYVVFFSTAASSPEEAPRGVDFIFDRQRFNVAISRARALAVMVGSPALLTHQCTSVEHVRVANGICSFVEAAERVDDDSPQDAIGSRVRQARNTPAVTSTSA